MIMNTKACLRLYFFDSCALAFAAFVRLELIPTMSEPDSLVELVSAITAANNFTLLSRGEGVNW